MPAALLGTWRLVSYTQRDSAEASVTHPYGEQPQGFLVYTADGLVNAQIACAPDARTPCASDDIMAATVDERARMTLEYRCYVARVRIDTAAQVVHHDIIMSLFPNRVGKTLSRAYEFSDDDSTLTLRPTSFTFGRSEQLVWMRARKGM